jgi:hypothetical protein
MPPYDDGPAMTLYRGASKHGWRFGFSWTADIDEAKQWVRRRDDVLVEARVEPAAIICKLEYPEPFSEEEKAELRREHPGAQFSEFHAEQEYVVDAAGLTHWQFLPCEPVDPAEADRLAALLAAIPR